MTTAKRKTVPPAAPPELRHGDRMTQAEFHRIYKRMPESFKAELIGGVVYVASSLKRPHDTSHFIWSAVFGTYVLNTPGVEGGDNTTVLLGEEGEPQPDVYLRILPEYGGQSCTTRDEYVKGAPELVAEVADSSRSVDLRGKRVDYQRYGVREYLVLCVREQKLRWFDLAADQELSAEDDGIVRVRSFPGLWIDGPALLSKDLRVLSVLEQGLATPEHAAFVQALASAAGRKKRPGRPRRKRSGGS
jgi:Uma2 family endonuclease